MVVIKYIKSINRKDLTFTLCKKLYFATQKSADQSKIFNVENFIFRNLVLYRFFKKQKAEPNTDDDCVFYFNYSKFNFE